MGNGIFGGGACMLLYILSYIHICTSTYLGHSIAYQIYPLMPENTNLVL